MIASKFPLVALSIAGLTGLSALSTASTVTLNRNAVVPVVVDTPLTFSDSRVGDVFLCHVASDLDLPSGTKFEGHITGIHPPRPRRPGSMDLVITSLDLPGAPPVDIQAIPIPINRDLVVTAYDGRMYARASVRNAGEYVAGGAIAGYAVGSLFHRRVLGTVLGALVGAVAADSENEKARNTVVSPGARLGVLFDRSVTVDVPGTGARRGSSRGWDSAGSSSRSRGWDSASGGAPATRGKGAWDSSPSAAPATHAKEGWDSAHTSTIPLAVPATPAPVATPGPVADVSIRFGDKTLSFDPTVAPYYEGETVMVPVQKMAEYLGLTFTKADNGAYYVESPTTQLKLEPGSVNYHLDGKASTLSHPTVEKAGILYAPVAVLAPLATKDLVVNGTKLGS